MRKLLTILVIALTAGTQPVQAHAEWLPDEGDRRQRSAGKAVQQIQENLPATSSYFEQAYGYAVWPTIGRVGFGFGGAYGRGVVIEQEQAVGTTSYWQFTSGIQAGAKTFSMIIFFRDKEALDDFRAGEIQFMGQAGIDIATVGAHGTPAYNDGVAVFAMTKLGLMGEFTISGVKFRYKPLPR